VSVETIGVNVGNIDNLTSAIDAIRQVSDDKDGHDVIAYQISPVENMKAFGTRQIDIESILKPKLAQLLTIRNYLSTYLAAVTAITQKLEENPHALEFQNYILENFQHRANALQNSVQNLVDKIRNKTQTNEQILPEFERVLKIKKYFTLTH